MVIDTERPVAPDDVAQLGLDLGFLMGLTLKTLYFAGGMSGIEIANRLALAPGPALQILDQLRRDHLCEVTGGSGHFPATLHFSLTTAGFDRAKDALAQCGYVGPAPIPLNEYIESVRRQSIHTVTLTRETIEENLSGLVLEQQTLDLIGQALTSERAMLLYGASGNGKSTAADALRHALPGYILIPHAIEVMQQVITVYDPSSHEAISDFGVGHANEFPGADRRWIAIKRPAVVSAGELAAGHLELVLDDATRTYDAPIQMKANGGVLVIDDFGRQRIDAAYLLNRWIVPLEKGSDHLSLQNGFRFQVPFDVIPMFLTNRPPADLADEAFLRRIRYKIEIPSPTASAFVEILRRECLRHDVTYDDAAAQYLIDHHIRKAARELRGCQPRNIVEAIADSARYQGTELALTPASIDSACATYFV